MLKLVWMFGVEVYIILWLQELAKEPWSDYGFIQTVCLLCLSIMLYANIMKVVVDIVSPPKE